MNKFVLAMLLPVIFFSPGWGEISTYQDYANDIEVFNFIRPGKMFITKDWVEIDQLLPLSIPERKTGFNPDEVEILTGFFVWVDYSIIPNPAMLYWRGNRYWVDIYPDEVKFSVLYYDAFGNDPSAGYPRAHIQGLTNSTLIETTLVYDGLEQGAKVYSARVSLPAGIYQYQYSCRNPARDDTYFLPISSFVVSRVPSGFSNQSRISDGETVSSAKIVLSWSATNQDEFSSAELSYVVYLWSENGTPGIIYKGKNTSCQLESLPEGKTYYWQVEAINGYGVSAKGPVWSFKTLSRPVKAFNYPNPFNPKDTPTTLVFNMARPGGVKISVYTEQGDLCWQKTFENLVSGTNEISYNGCDDNGVILYNGPYTVILEKFYTDGSSEKDRCRILVIR